ncbi:MAG: asparagine synthase (glutamine-hydrolyzing) [Proteobacteria bacterium]|nr:asparagine synthase (glutamine-hydrolyzing) [Pseudomonadota bacterium]
MCGIWGAIYKQEQDLSYLKDLSHKMHKSLEHRGPDDMGQYLSKKVLIANTRLSILDIEHGQQPFSDRGVHVVQNGEIFNFIELREELSSKHSIKFKTDSDTEVILYSYIVWGKDFVNKLNGMFAIAIYDENIDKLLIFRDRIGVKPLYYYQDNERLVFASEIKTILAADAKKEPCLQALNMFLSFNYIPVPLTAFEGIYSINPGEYLEIDKNLNIKKTTWWDLTKFANDNKDSEKDVIKNIMSVLDDASKIRMRSDVEVGSFLSGGIDSSTIVALSSKYTDKPLQTFSIGFSDKRFDESNDAAYIAKRFNTKHVNKISNSNSTKLWEKFIYHCDQPHGDVSFMPTYQVSDLASKHVKVVLTGDGADELFAGYGKYKCLEDSNYDMNHYFNDICLLSQEQKSELCIGELKKLNKTNSYNDFIKDFRSKTEHLDTLNKALAFDMFYLLSGNNMVKPDRMGMAKSIEARNPFLDYRLVEYALTLPASLKMKNQETKYILKKAVTPLIGDRITYKPKQMFTVPIGEWLKDDLKDYLIETLTSDKFKSRGLFNQQRVEEMMTDHISGKENYTRELRALISIEIWFRVFFS